MTGRAKRIVAGVCSITFRGLPADEVIAVAERAGVGGIEWGGDVHAPPGKTSNAAALARRCRDAGIDVTSYGSYLGFARPDGRVGEIDRVLDSAEALGTRVVRVWTERGVTPESPATDRSRVRDHTAAIADAAAQRGVTLALEYHPGTLTHTAAATNDLLNELDRPNLLTHWQPDPALSPRDAVHELRAVLPRLAYLHVFTWGAAGIDDRRPLADGGELWPAALALASQCALPWSGARYALCEYVRDDSPAQLVEDATTLRRWIDELDA